MVGPRTSMTALALFGTETHRGTAYHEAGHVLAACAFQQMPGGVTIIPDLDDGALGSAGTGTFSPEYHETYAAAVRRSPRSAAWSFTEGLCVSVAGYVAEARWRKESFAILVRERNEQDPDGEDPDIVKALAWARWRLGGKRDERAQWRLVYREARKVDAFLVAHWRHVEVLARRLLREGEVSGDGIQRTLARLPPVARWRT